MRRWKRRSSPSTLRTSGNHRDSNHAWLPRLPRLDRRGNGRALNRARCWPPRACARPPAWLGADPKLLPPEQAFRFSARLLDDRTIEARFAVEDGYYLYRDKLKFAVEPDAIALPAPDLPAGKVKDDQFFGRVETYRGDVVVTLPLAHACRGAIDRARRRFAGLRRSRRLLPGQPPEGHAGRAGGRQGARSQSSRRIRARRTGSTDRARRRSHRAGALGYASAHFHQG